MITYDGYYIFITTTDDLHCDFNKKLKQNQKIMNG